MTSSTHIHGNLQAVSPSSIIELYEIHLDQALHGSEIVYRLSPVSDTWTEAQQSFAYNRALSGGIVFKGQTYEHFPITADGFAMSGNGQLPRPSLKVSNLLGLTDQTQVSIFSIVLNTVNATTPFNDLTGAKFVRIRTLLKFLDADNWADSVTGPYPPGGSYAASAASANIEFPREIYFLDRKVLETRDLVEWELASVFDIAGVRAPKRQCIANVCQWVYKDPETCGYDPATQNGFFNASDETVLAEADDVCSKRLSSCRIRFGEENELPYGSFPGVGYYTG